MMTSAIKKAVIPVAGLGTRFLPATKAMPKEMLTVVDRPLIQYAVEELFAAGIEEIIFVTGRNKSALEDHFDHAYELEATLESRGKIGPLSALVDALPPEGNFVYTRQQRPLGLGHAVWCARHFIGHEPFAVVLPDDLVLADVPCMQQMVEAYEACGGANIVGIMDVPRAQTSRYGIIEPGESKDQLVEVKGLVEKPDPKVAPSTLSVIGRYILMPEIFEFLGRKQTGAGGEIQLTDAMAQLLGQQPFYGFAYAGTRFDCGDKVGYMKANIAFGLARAEMREPLVEFMQSLGVGKD